MGTSMSTKRGKIKRREISRSLNASYFPSSRELSFVLSRPDEDRRLTDDSRNKVTKPVSNILLTVGRTKLSGDESRVSSNSSLPLSLWLFLRLDSLALACSSEEPGREAKTHLQQSSDVDSPVEVHHHSLDGHSCEKGQTKERVQRL